MSLSSIRRARATSRPARRRLAVEPLESRLTPAITLNSAVVTNYATLSGQPPSDITHDLALDMQTDSAGNRYTLGMTYDFGSSIITYHLAKFDAAGDNSTAAWVTTFDHPDNDAGVGAIALDSAGTIYVAMRLHSTVQGSPQLTEVVKVDSAGQPVPGQSYLDTRPTNANGLDVATDAAGFVYYTSPGRTAKLESQAAGLVRVDDYAVGGDALDVSPDGGRVYVTGSFTGVAVDFDPYHAYADNRDKLSTVSRSRDWNPNVFILELARGSTGSLEYAWAGQVGTDPVTLACEDLADDIIVDGTGIYILGYYTDNGGQTNTSSDFDPNPAVRYSLPFKFGGQDLTGNIFLLKLDLNHQFQWVNGLGGTAQNSSDSTGNHGGLFLDGQGGVYVADNFHSSGVDFDIEHSYPGNIDRPAGGGAYAGDANLFVAKYGTRNGAFRWAAVGNSVNPGNTSSGGAMTTGGVVVTGNEITVFSSLRGTMDINPGGVRLVADTWGDVFFAKFTQTADPVQLYAKNVVQTEGNTGTTAFTFLLMLSDPVGYDVTVNFATANGTATAGSDYSATTGSVTFLAGETQKQVTVMVTGDGTAEVDETFALNLSAPILGFDGSLQALASISNDDALRGKK